MSLLFKYYKTYLNLFFYLMTKTLTYPSFFLKKNPGHCYQNSKRGRVRGKVDVSNPSYIV